MRRLASIYLDGVVVKKDYDIAASFYRKAADKGDPAAQFSLAVMLEKGQGIALATRPADSFVRAKLSQFTYIYCK